MTQLEHNELVRRIILECSHGPTRLFRSFGGLAYQGTIVERTPRRLVLLNPRTIRIGANGMSDLTGWSDGGRYLAIEAKTGNGVPTPEQKAFVDMVRHLGGRAGIARSVEDAFAIINQETIK